MAGTQAFDASRESLWVFDPNDLIVVGVDTDDGLEHPLVNHRVLQLREMWKSGRFDEEFEALVKSIMLHGVLEPVVVRKNGAKAEIVLGRNRTLATREANRRKAEIAPAGEQIKVRGIQRKNNEVKSLTGAVEAENNVRRGDDPLTKARNARRQLDMGVPKGQVAIDMGVSDAVLDKLLLLPELSPQMQKAVEEGFITPTAAGTYSDMPHEEQDKILDEARRLGIVISVPEARRQRQSRSIQRRTGGKGGVSMRGSAVSASVLRKVYEDEEFQGSLDKVDAKALFRWIIGEGSYRSVPGLSQSLRRVGALKADKGED